MTVTLKPPERSNVKALLPIGVGALVSISLGAYVRFHEPAGAMKLKLGFTAPINFKVWFATLALVLALVQIATALRMYDRVSWPRTVPLWFGDFHRLTGTLAFAATLPVAFHCLWGMGRVGVFLDDPRRLVHSALGCLFFGAFATKVLAVRDPDSPPWLLPVVGGTIFTALVGVWLTSSVWFWSDKGFPSF